MKKLLSLLVALTLLVSMVPVTAKAANPVASGTCGAALTWTLNEEGLLTISGTGQMNSGTGPAHVWLTYQNYVKRIVLEEGVTSIDDGAFHNFTYLTSVEIPASVVSIGNNAFANGYSLISVELSEGITAISDGAFEHCDRLPNIRIPASVNAIGAKAFNGCLSLKDIVFQGDAPAIGAEAFGSVEADVYYPVNNSTWTANKMQNYSGTLIWRVSDDSKAGIVAAGTCGENLTWTLDEEGLLTVSGTGAMDSKAGKVWDDYKKEIKQVVVETGVTTVDDNAFWNCIYLTSVELPASVTAIGSKAFAYCYSLLTAVIANGVTTIGDEAFLYCQHLTSVELPASVTAIGSKAFAYCHSLTAAELSEGVLSIGDSAFDYCDRLASVEIPASVNSIGKNAFSECLELKNITFKGTAPAIGTNAFYKVNAEVCYPAGDLTWTEDVKQNYGGTVIWVPYCVNEEHTFENGTCIGCGKVQPAPVIVVQPTSVEQEIGKKFAVTVKTEGEGLTYQWYYKDAGMKNFGVSGNKTSSYAYTMQTYMHNRQVYCVITDRYGNRVTTETATITRPPMKLALTAQPQDVCAAIGEKFSVKPTVQGDGLTYQWYYKDSYMKDFAASSNKTSAYAYAMQTYMHNRQVYCVITDRYSNSVTTETVTITRPPVELILTAQPQGVCAAIGEKFSVKPAVQGDGLTYQWYYKDNYMKEFTVSSNKTSAYAYSMASYMNGRQVYCVITDQYGNQVTTESVTIHVAK